LTVLALCSVCHELKKFEKLCLIVWFHIASVVDNSLYNQNFQITLLSLSQTHLHFLQINILLSHP
jgi:hypothetical protein